MKATIEVQRTHTQYITIEVEGENENECIEIAEERARQSDFTDVGEGLLEFNSVFIETNE